MQSPKTKPETEPLPESLKYLIRNMADESVDQWKRQRFRDRLFSVKMEIDTALSQYEQDGKRKK